MMIPWDCLSPPGIPLIGFGGKPVTTLSQIDLAVTFGDDFVSQTEVVTFYVVQIPYQYNTILGCATPNAFIAITHYNYLCMKIPAPEGKITIRRDQDLVRQTEFEAITLAYHVHTVKPDPGAQADPLRKNGCQKPNMKGTF